MSAAPARGDIVCLSHLVWDDTLFQRPQQLMLRLARMNFRVFYVAQRSFKQHLLSYLNRCAAREGRVDPNLWFWNRQGFVGPADPPKVRELKLTALLGFLNSLACGYEIQNPWLWIYYPQYAHLAPHLPHSKLIYDCMDPFEHFQAGGENLRAGEQLLLQQADVVFTGGRSLHTAKAGINPATYCFPSGIDARHFERALDPRTAIPPDLQILPRPVYGYFGAIDERIDWPLIETLCAANATGSIVFLGPLVGLKKIPVAAKNFHHLGPKPYAALPAYLKGFDVCLLPFVINDLTKKLSPTKTPEYLAGGKPVVSTPLPDVAADYADFVAIAADADSFAAACTRAAANPPNPAAPVAEQVRKQSWDAIAAEMVRRIEG